MFDETDRAKELREKLESFMDSHIYPAEPVYREQMEAQDDPHAVPPILQELKGEARSRGL